MTRIFKTVPAIAKCKIYFPISSRIFRRVIKNKFPSSILHNFMEFMGLDAAPKL